MMAFGSFDTASTRKYFVLMQNRKVVAAMVRSGANQSLRGDGKGEPTEDYQLCCHRAATFGD
jgi:hypothetical protein